MGGPLYQSIDQISVARTSVHRHRCVDDLHAFQDRVLLNGKGRTVVTDPDVTTALECCRWINAIMSF